MFDESDVTILSYSQGREILEYFVPLFIVLHLAAADASRSYDLRLDALGSVEVDVPPGVYSLGLVYQPL